MLVTPKSPVGSSQMRSLHYRQPSPSSWTLNDVCLKGEIKNRSSALLINTSDGTRSGPRHTCISDFFIAAMKREAVLLRSEKRWL